MKKPDYVPDVEDYKGYKKYKPYKAFKGLEAIKQESEDEEDHKLSGLQPQQHPAAEGSSQSTSGRRNALKALSELRLWGRKGGKKEKRRLVTFDLI